MQLAAIRVELNQLRDELDGCIANQDFKLAAELKERVTQLDVAKQQLLADAQPHVIQVRIEKVGRTISNNSITDNIFNSLTATMLFVYVRC